MFKSSELGYMRTRLESMKVNLLVMITIQDHVGSRFAFINLPSQNLASELTR